MYHGVVHCMVMWSEQYGIAVTWVSVLGFYDVDQDCLFIYYFYIKSMGTKIAELMRYAPISL